MENRPESTAPGREEPAAERKNTTNRVLILIIAVLTIVCGILLWQFLEQRKATTTEVAEKQEVTEEKDALTQELENMLQQYEMLQTDNTTLQQEIESQKSKIEQLLADVDKYRGQASLMSKYKKETVTLREIMKSYVATIDSLNQVNQYLTEENLDVKNRLTDEQRRAAMLEGEKGRLTDKVRAASVLDALQPLATGIATRSGGRERETNRVKNSEKIRTCFTLSENKIAAPGDKTVYVRIKTPAGKILAESADESSMAEFDGVRGVYSAKKTIDYQNKAQTVCTYYTVKPGESLPEGKYYIDIFADGTIIGTTSMELK